MKLLLIFLLFQGCSAISLNPGADKIRVTREEPKDCEYLGEVIGSQGNWFTGGSTSNKNLELGARNDLKNNAHKMGGNVVVLLTDRAGVSGYGNQYGGSSSAQTNVTITGAVFKCSDRIVNSLSASE